MFARECVPHEASRVSGSAKTANDRVRKRFALQRCQLEV